MNPVWQIPQLQHIERVARRFGVSITLRGGVAFRFALFNHRQSPPIERLDLFDLAPFTADVDLSHSGATEITRPLLDAILEEGQSAECFRWELRAGGTMSAPRQSLTSNFVPARLIEIVQSPDEGIVDPAGGLTDIKEGRYRYFRNPLFKQSHRYQAGRDIEAFSALLYLQTLAEAGISEPSNQPGWSSMRDVFAAASEDPDLPLLVQQHAYLRGRLRHLLRAVAAAYPSRDAFRGIAEQAGLSPWLRRLDSGKGALGLDTGLAATVGLDEIHRSGALIASDRIGGDTYRLDAPSTAWAQSAPAEMNFPKLGEHQHVLLVSPEITVSEGAWENAYYTSLGELEAGSWKFRQQFIYANISPYALPPLKFEDILDSGLEDINISAITMLKNKEGQWSPFSFSTTATTQRGDGGQIGGQIRQLSLRINCLGLLADPSVASAVIVVVKYEDRLQ